MIGNFASYLRHQAVAYRIWIKQSKHNCRCSWSCAWKQKSHFTSKTLSKSGRIEFEISALRDTVNSEWEWSSKGLSAQSVIAHAAWPNKTSVCTKTHVSGSSYGCSIETAFMIDCWLEDCKIVSHFLNLCIFFVFYELNKFSLFYFNLLIALATSA